MKKNYPKMVAQNEKARTFASDAKKRWFLCVTFGFHGMRGSRDMDKKLN